MVDYSKWDNIELSDDSDAATHPIHSKSALKHTKQKRVHTLRRERSFQVKALGDEKAFNSALLQHLQRLASILKNSPPNAQTCQEMLSLALAKTTPTILEQDAPPSPSTASSSVSTYSDILQTIAFRIEEALDGENIDKAGFASAILDVVESQSRSIRLRQEGITKQLKRYKTNKITSESYCVTTDSSNISRCTPSSTAPATGAEAD